MALRLITTLALATILSFDALAQCPDPNVSLSLTHTPALVCDGRPLQFDATSYPGATYFWTGPVGSGINGVLAANPVSGPLNAAHSGVYSVTMNYNGCNYTANVNVNVNSTPQITKVNYRSPICPGQTDSLEALASGITGIAYHWMGPNFGPISNNTSNWEYIYNIRESNEGVYRLITEAPSGCTDTAYFNIVVHPEITAQFTVDPKPGCDEDSIIITNTSIGHTTSSWAFGDGINSTQSDPVHIYANQGSYTVTLIADNNVCKDTLEQIVVFNHSVSAGFTVDDDSICQNNTVNFTNNTTYVPAILPTYEWDFMDGGTDNSIDPSHLYERFGIYNVKLLVTDHIGCKDSAFHTVVVDSTGSISFTTTDTVLCTGKTIGFAGTYMQQGLTGALWDMADGSQLGGVNDINYTFDKAGTYPVTFTAFYRVCPNAVFTKNIVIKPHPQVNLGADTSICPNGRPVMIRDIVNEGNPNVKWVWNTPAKDRTSNIIVRHEGVYAVTVDLDGCTSSDTVVVRNNCYINIPNAFSPNGDGNDDYFLPRELLSKSISGFSMSIFNRWGQQIFATNNITGRGWDGSFNGRPQPLDTYVYLIKVQFKDGVSENYEGNVTLLR